MFYADHPGDLPDPDQVRAISGLEFMQGVLQGTIACPPMWRLVGMRLHSVQAGRIVMRANGAFEAANQMGAVHGGWYGAVLDSAMACAIMSQVAQGSVFTTLEYKINIMRAIPVGLEAECIGLTDHVGRSTGVAHGEIRGVADGRLYATGSTTGLVMRAPPRAGNGEAKD